MALDTKGIITVTTEKLVKTLTAILKTKDLVPYVVGPAGIGKSSIVSQIAERDFDRNLIDIRLGQLQEEDLIGIPTVRNERTYYNLPMFWPTEGKGIMHFDELNRATKGMFQCLFQLVLDRKYFYYIFPPDWRMVFSGNWGEANYFVGELDPAMRNRLVSIYYTGPTYDEWKKWAIENLIADEVISFLAIHNDMLITEAVDDRPYPTPRSWHQASSILKASEDRDVRKVALSGVIGIEAAVMLLEYIEKEYEALPDPGNLKKATETLEKWFRKNQNDRITAFLNTIVDYVAKGNRYDLKEFNKFIAILPKEFTFSLIKGLFERKESRNFVMEFAEENEEVFETIEVGLNG